MVSLNKSRKNEIPEFITFLKKKKFVHYGFQEGSFQVHSLSSNDKFIQFIPRALRYNVNLLFFVYYAKKKFKNLKEIEGFLTSNSLLKNMGLNSQLIMKLIIYVSFITGEMLLEYSESGSDI